MRITEVEKRELEEIYSFFYTDEKIQKMKEIPMHRGSNTFNHSFQVAKVAIKRGLRHKHVDLKSILIASILHDYYLYDWRRDRNKLKRHGQNHPYIAATNAKADFDITEEVQKIIQAHMWPINFKEFPRTKEARIVNLADDHVALKEALTSKRFKKRRTQKIAKKIEKLFQKGTNEGSFLFTKKHDKF